MRQLHETIAIKLLLVLFSFSAFAAGPVMRVVNVEGSAFLVRENGSTLRLQKDYHIDDLSQVMVDESAQVTMVDYNENTYHLSPSTQVKVVGEDLHLTQGNVWVQSTSKPSLSGYNILSPNGAVNYKQSDFIYSYNNADGKSQVYVIKGEVDFSNRFEKHYKYSIESGKFSFIENKYEEGHPRVPTNLGYTSFQKITGIFKNVKMNVGKTRIIASTPRRKAARKVASIVNHASNRGGVLFISSKKVSREPNSVDKKSIKKYTPAKKATPYKKVSINYYGYGSYTNNAKRAPVRKVTSFKVVAPIKKQRVPSSIKPVSVIKKEEYSKTNFDNTFEKSLNKNYKQQEKNPAELNDLIDELESYSNDFKKTYY
jgi:hypothetical protein